MVNGQLTDTETIAWYCVRSLPKHEHIAAGNLRKMSEMEVFLPRIRFKRSTRRGPAWVTEALFPGYFFARFNLFGALRLVQSVAGVRGVVRFGDRWPEVPAEVIHQIRLATGPEELCLVNDEFTPGETVQVAGGAFSGLSAVVSRVMSGGQRVVVLMELLGNQLTVEVPAHDLIKNVDERVGTIGQNVATAMA